MRDKSLSVGKTGTAMAVPAMPCPTALASQQMYSLFSLKGTP